MAQGQTRLDLQSILESFMEPENSRHVYFQPPNGYQIEYPCIIYKRNNVSTQFADNAPYRRSKRYTVTVIDRDPDSAIPDKVAELPTCEYNRFYTADNLNHDVFTIYF